MSHTCHAEGCSIEVDPSMLACGKHWYMIEKWLRDALWRVYKPGQERGRAPVTDDYIRVQTRCRLFIATTEAVSRPEMASVAARVEQELIERLQEICPPGMLDEQLIPWFDLLLKNPYRAPRPKIPRRSV